MKAPENTVDYMTIPNDLRFSTMFRTAIKNQNDINKLSILDNNVCAFRPYENCNISHAFYTSSVPVQIESISNFRIDFLVK